MIKMAFIPARYAATRFPYKLMQPLGDKTVIRHTYDNTVATGLFDEVIVVTDHEIIYNEITNNGGKAVMSVHEHDSGSDRIAEAAMNIEVDVIVNVQGDEPFIERKALEELLHVFEGEAGKDVQAASLYKLITDPDSINNPNVVKLVTDIYHDALYFSRNPIPFLREATGELQYKEHIGIYAFRKKILLQFTKWPSTLLEKAEKLEQLRYLEHGVKIKMVETNASFVKIDVPEDLPKAEQYLAGLKPQ